MIGRKRGSFSLRDGSWSADENGVRPLDPTIDGARGKMDEDTFNISLRKFLKTLGVTAQREIELTVREQLAAGELKGNEVLETTATVTVRGLRRDVIVTGTIALS
jgi:Family of unknown function (DUF6494)